VCAGAQDDDNGGSGSREAAGGSSRQQEALHDIIDLTDDRGKAEAMRTAAAAAGGKTGMEAAAAAGGRTGMEAAAAAATGGRTAAAAVGCGAGTSSGVHELELEHEQQLKALLQQQKQQRQQVYQAARESERASEHKRAADELRHEISGMRSDKVRQEASSKRLKDACTSVTEACTVARAIMRSSGVFERELRERKLLGALKWLAECGVKRDDYTQIVKFLESPRCDNMAKDVAVSNLNKMFERLRDMAGQEVCPDREFIEAVLKLIDTGSLDIK
jgi:hypothetical protein